METKSLRAIQILAKIARIIFMIIFVACIVGAAGCLIGFIVLPIVQNIVVDGSGKTVADVMIENLVLPANVYGSMTAGIIGCGGGIALGWINQKFYQEEIVLGTPFEIGIVKKMRKVAIINIVVSVSVSLLSVIATSIVLFVLKGNISGQWSIWGSIFYGVFLLILSLFCEYGAAIKAQPAEEKAEPSENEEKAE